MVLAPMANVTDAAFRAVIAKYGKPDVMYTEFVSVEGLLSRGRETLLLDFMFTPAERPIVAQIFGSEPASFTKVAALCRELGFDGIDINMGCPDRSVEKQGAGAALIKNPELAREIIEATKRGAGGLPVSVKTRLGYNTNILDEWLPHLLKAKPAAIIFHLRTRKEMSDVPARWDEMARAVEIANRLCRPEDLPVMLGNGDVKDLAEAREKAAASGADGVMIGRGIFGNPWLFGPDAALGLPADPGQPDAAHPDPRRKIAVMLEHTFLYEKIFAGKKNFDIMRKHYKAYANGFAGAKDLRVKLMETKTAPEAAAVAEKFFPGIKFVRP